MEHYTEIGRQIKRIRKQQGLIQAELAERIGSTKSDISDIERGRKKVSIGRLGKIGKALGASLEVIIKKDKKK